MDNKALLVSTEKANEQAKLVEELKGMLAQDLEKTKYERDELKKYHDALAERVNKVQAELSQLYRANKAIAREMAEARSIQTGKAVLPEELLAEEIK